MHMSQHIQIFNPGEVIVPHRELGHSLFIAFTKCQDITGMDCSGDSVAQLRVPFGRCVPRSGHRED